MSIIDEIFEVKYPGETDIYTAFCPYRVCPLGAHVDHQKGLITGFAISHGIHMIYSPTEDGEVSLHSINLFGDHTFNVNKIPEKQNDWADYLRGATSALSRTHEISRGIRAVVNGTLPIGGLSSSAALTIVFLSALCNVNDIKLSDKEIIEYAMSAENQYVGVKCGILDHSCEVLSKKGHLLYLDTVDSSYELMPESKKAPPYQIAVFFSGVERTLVGSPFNTRVDELKAAAFSLKAYAGIEYTTISDSYMRDVPYEVFLEYGDKLPDNLRKRAIHFYTEYERVKLGAKAWQNGNLNDFGKLIFESGYSSICNFDTGSPELKKLYELMRQTDGIYGGRFSGAGFKGCCMAIVDPSFKESITEKITREYISQFPKLRDKFSIFYCDTADGCKFE